jgi:hypothetical protein
MDAAQSQSFVEALHSDGAAKDHSDKLRLYAWLAGSWDMDVLIHGRDATIHSTRGFVRAGWVLQGRAIRDVFAVPGLFYGTSLRFCDPHIDGSTLDLGGNRVLRHIH